MIRAWIRGPGRARAAQTAARPDRSGIYAVGISYLSSRQSRSSAAAENERRHQLLRVCSNSMRKWYMYTMQGPRLADAKFDQNRRGSRRLIPVDSSMPLFGFSKKLWPHELCSRMQSTRRRCRSSLVCEVGRCANCRALRKLSSTIMNLVTTPVRDSHRPTPSSPSPQTTDTDRRRRFPAGGARAGGSPRPTVVIMLLTAMVTLSLGRGEYDAVQSNCDCGWMRSWL